MSAQNSRQRGPRGKPQQKSNGFAKLGLDPQIVSTLAKIGFEQPTPIQTRAIPPALAGEDVLGQARTGTGKTAAFGLPILSRLDRQAEHVQALILAPTRELALQISEELERYGEHQKPRIATIYGGAAYEPQEEALANHAQIVVGTPGRIMDHMERGNLDLRQCAMMVLDEADRMLDMGFIDDVAWILRHMPGKHDRQTMLFSATMPEEIRSLTIRFMRKAVRVRVSGDELTVPAIDQHQIRVGRRNKLWALMRLLGAWEKEMRLCVVFCATQHMCDRLEGDLKNQGVEAEAIHGGLSQAKREKVLKRFEEGHLKVLIATDVAARGLDIDDITHVVNWDLPEQEPETYVHRIGRTGRAGREGRAVSFVSADDRPVVKRIEMLTGRPMEEIEVPHLPKGQKDKVRRAMDWDEMTDRYGMVHLSVNAGTEDGLTPYRLHRLVQRGSGLEDHMIQQIVVTPHSASFRVAKDRALRAKDAVGNARFDGRKLHASFVTEGDEFSS